MARVIMLLMLAACAAVSTAARAAFDPPDWRGRGDAAYLEWRFNCDDNPSTPEVAENVSGSPLADIDAGPYASGWWLSGLVFGARYGFWDLGDGSINIELSGQYREIWIEIIYFKDLTIRPGVTVAGGQALGSPEMEFVEPGWPGTAWYRDRTKWQLPPGPDPNTVTITGLPPYGSVVDQIVIDAMAPIPGDANFDCSVNILDLIYVRNRLRKDPASADNWNADVNGDGAINILDMLFVRNHLSTSCQ